MSAVFRFQGWQYHEPPPDPQVVIQLIAEAPIELPQEYLNLLRCCRAGGGSLAVEPGWFQLWPADEVLNLNRSYGVQDELPHLFGFGSNGGGELLAFDTRSGPPWKVVMVPFIGMDEEDVEFVADAFEDFLRATGCEMLEPRQSAE